MFSCILVAVDINDSTAAKRCMDAALRLARSEGSTLHVLNVVPDSGMAIVDSLLGPDHAQKMVDAAKTALEEWAAETIPEGVTAELHISHGTIYDSILKAAKTVGADAIIVGAHRPGLQDYLIGPNAARVARHADQSVIVIR